MLTVGLETTSSTHHYVVLSYLAAGEILGAQKHLRSIEETAITPNLATYNAVISALVRSSSTTPANRAAAWDLFAHMRLVSHPTPDLPLFNTMIHACASGSDPSPERAQDLLQELQDIYRSTQDEAFLPDTETYTALIRACARTRRKGEEGHYVQGLEYLKRMLDEGLQPNRETLHSIMEGAKRVGDLARARWIFLRLLDQEDGLQANDVSVALLFQAYATYKPPVRRGLRMKAVTRDADEEQIASTSTTTEAKESDSLVETSLQDSPDSQQLAFPGPMPQSSQQVVAQMQDLLARIARAQKQMAADKHPTQDVVLFKEVELSTYLFNAYLSALAAHNTFSANVPIYATIFEQYGVEKNGHTFTIIMEAAERPTNKAAGLELARKTFEEWKSWSSTKPVEDIEAQAVWTSFIRSLVRNKLGSEALEQALLFYKTHPPSNLSAAANVALEAHTTSPRAQIQLANPSYPETFAKSGSAPKLVYADVASLYKLLKDSEDRSGLRRLLAILKRYRDAEAKVSLTLKRGSLMRSRSNKMLAVGEAVEE